MRGLLIAVAAVLAAASAAWAQHDPFGPPPPAGSAAALVRASQLGEAGAAKALERWLAANPEAPQGERADALSELCGVYYVRSWFAQAAIACAAAAEIDENNAQAAAMAKALSALPPIRAVGSARVGLTDNAYGSHSVEVRSSGERSDWIVDTGAQVTVATKSVADRLGVRMLDGQVSVGSSTADVTGGLGVIEVLRIGDAYAENVPVFVLPDAQLAVTPGAPPIPGILGLPVMVAFGRIGWLEDGRTLALGDAAPAVADATHRIYWHEEGVGVGLATARGAMGAHLDTGANRSSLRTPGLSLLTEAELATRVTRSLTRGGAGGLVSRQGMEFPALTLTIGGVPTPLTRLAVDEDEQGAGRIGMDAVKQYRTFVLDFERMTLKVDAR